MRYFARVLHTEKAYRWQLFGDEPDSPKNNRLYHKLILDEIQTRPQPILSRRWRRITFIPTTWTKFIKATEINDLYDESPLENRLWAALKRRQIPAERQEFVTVDQGNYFLDFAIYCDKGNLNVETDGDVWHNNPERAAGDRLRDNALVAAGWTIQRFGTQEIWERLEEYCISRVIKSINRLGGIDERKLLARKLDPDAEDDDPYQPGLFD